MEQRLYFLLLPHTVLAGSPGYFYLHVALACSCFLTLTAGLRKGHTYRHMCSLSLFPWAQCAQYLLLSQHGPVSHRCWRWLLHWPSLPVGLLFCLLVTICLFILARSRPWNRLSLSSTFFSGIIIDVQVVTWRGNLFQRISMLRTKHDSYFRRGRFHFGTGYISLNRQ